MNSNTAHKKHSLQVYGTMVANHQSVPSYTGTLTDSYHKTYSNHNSKTHGLIDGNWFASWHWRNLLTTFLTLLGKVLDFNSCVIFFVNGNVVVNRWVSSRQVGNVNHHDHHHTHGCSFLTRSSDFYQTSTVDNGLQTNSQVNVQSSFILCFTTH